MKLRSVLFCLILLCLASWVTAQDSTGTEKSKSPTRTVTGCLTKGDSANEFLLTASDGSTWEVRSGVVDLSQHVGHTVEATGVVSHNKMHNMKEDTKEMSKDAGLSKTDTEHGHMKITDVKMISDSCK